MIRIAWTALFFALSGGLPVAFGQSDPQLRTDSPQDKSSSSQQKNSSLGSIRFLIGTSRWAGPGNLPALPAELAKYGSFPVWGYNLEISGHRRITRIMGNELRIGGDLGLFYRAGKKSIDATILPAGDTVPQTMNARGLYLTPSLRYVFGKTNEKLKPRWSTGAGGGFYAFDIVTMLGAMELDTYYRKYTFGGYVSGGVAIPVSSRHPERALLFEGKIHFVRFGNFESVTAGTTSLNGPIYIFQLGVGL
jgi:hypothetical protein